MHYEQKLQHRENRLSYILVEGLLLIEYENAMHLLALSQLNVESHHLRLLDVQQ